MERSCLFTFNSLGVRRESPGKSNLCETTSLAYRPRAVQCYNIN